jgi:Xaa-Pro aminopeptidase
MRRLLTVLMLAATIGWAAPGASTDEFRTRREALREQLGNGVVILMGAGEAGLRSAFFQEPNFYYLSGWTEPGAILVIAPDDETLFIPRRDPDGERWHGVTADPLAGDIRETTGFQSVMPAETFESALADIIEGASQIYTLTDDAFAGKLQSMLPLRDVKDASRAIARLRMTKSEAEQALIRRSVDITIKAHRTAWERIEPGRHEYEFAAAMAGVYLGAGCERPAYAPIVGSGPNSTVMHYNRNSRRFDAGEMIVMDVGAECSYYAADITRTLPASGKFTKRQREIYNLVLGAQQAVIEAVKPGVILQKGPGSLYQIAKDYFDEYGDGYGKYFTHGIGHHVGLDVHDAFDPSTPLAAGMIITVEPGLYLPDENLGVRIEDMILVTETGSEVLSRTLPKSVKALERALR